MRSGQVERQWQEKLLALRMEKLFGRRFVATSREHRAGADPGALRSDRGRGGARAVASRTGSRLRQHLFFAWADLAVCSVFLFEFTLKLALAPHQDSYFLRHVLIDLLASLPFGFVAHMIELDRLGDLRMQPAARARSGGRPGSPGWRGAFRFLRVVLPIVRLARLGLILLRLSDRAGPPDGQAAQPQHRVVRAACTRKNPSRATGIGLIALRSETRARASERARPGWTATRPCGYGSAVLARSREPRRAVLPTPTREVDPFAEPTSREIPVEAVVERLIQMTPERLIDQMGPVQVKAIDRYLRLLDLPLVAAAPVRSQPGRLPRKKLG